jgi:hypothetical protein
MIWWRRLVALAVALALTAVVFEFYAVFATAVGHYLSLPPPAAQSETAKPEPGVVSVQIIPTKPPPCPKEQPCPKPK